MIFFLYIFLLLFEYLHFLYWVQIKEYRWDRFRELLKSQTGLKKIFAHWILFQSLALVFGNTFFSYVAILFLVAMASKKVLLHKIKLPVFTLRINRILYTNLIAFVVLIILFNRQDPVGFSNYSYLFLTVMLYVTSWIGIFLTGVSVKKAKLKESKKAAEKLKKIKVISIGITGSYGKTTTKDFVATLLSTKHKVDKTTKNQNNEFGISRKIIEDFDINSNFFVCEMGAYKKGEIKALCDIVRPKVGIITGIEFQHASLFGSLEDIKKAKFELINSLPQNGTAIFNTTRESTANLIKRAKNLNKNLKIIKYKRTNAIDQKNDTVQAKVVKNDKNNIVFEVFIEGKIRVFEVNLEVEYFIENVVAAIIVARLFSVSWQEIKSGLRKIKKPIGTMNSHQIGEGLLIDDSYNSTPVGFESALTFLKKYEGTKVVVTPGIIELGKYDKKIHEGLSNKMMGIVDTLVVTDKYYYNLFRKKLKSKDIETLYIDEVSGLKQFVEDELAAGSAVLLEGRVPGNLSDLIVKNELN